MSRDDAGRLNDTMVQGLAQGDAGQVAPVYAQDAPLADAGKFLILHRRQPDGSWRYAADMFNSSLTPAPD